MLEIDRIKALAKQRGIKFSALCARLGLSPNFLNDAALGKSPLTESRLEQIAEILQTTPDYLHGKTDELSVPSESEKSKTENPPLDVPVARSLNILIEFYKSFSEEQQNELVEEAFRIWKGEKKQ